MQRLVSGTDPLSPAQVAEAYPWPDGGWLRAMMVTTLDGAAAGPDGLSKSVTSPADQLVFNAVRRFADAVLIGAGTLRAERYTPMLAKPADAAVRSGAGQRPAPVVCVVSQSLRLPLELPLWTESDQTPIVLTSTSADPERLAAVRAIAAVVVLPELGAAAIRSALFERGLRRIVCEGGPSLLRDFVAAGLVDEADITITPCFAGSASSPRTELLTSPVPFALAHVLEQDGTLIARYLKADT